LEKDVVDPETYAQETAKKPVSSSTAEIVKIAKSLLSDLFVILKWPLIGDVESSMVRRKD
jgi:hypothetical protein